MLKTHPLVLDEIERIESLIYLKARRGVYPLVERDVNTFAMNTIPRILWVHTSDAIRLDFPFFQSLLLYRSRNRSEVGARFLSIFHIIDTRPLRSNPPGQKGKATFP